MLIRPEQNADHDAVREVVRLAFATHPHSTQNEHRIVDALRAGNAMTMALVAVENSEILGFVACSSIKIDGADRDWVGLGPIAVRPDRQRRRIGSQLMETCIGSLKAMKVSGIVLLGDPAYYGRFGFVPSCDLTLPGVPAGYFLKLHLAATPQFGVVSYHSAFATE